jgi:hypothetical protein
MQQQEQQQQQQQLLTTNQNIMELENAKHDKRSHRPPHWGACCCQCKPWSGQGSGQSRPTGSQWCGQGQAL